jgi:hypothetical protein
MNCVEWFLNMHEVLWNKVIESSKIVEKFLLFSVDDIQKVHEQKKRYLLLPSFALRLLELLTYLMEKFDKRLNFNTLNVFLNPINGAQRLGK